MKSFWIFVSGIAVIIGMVGCESVSKPYIMQTDRVDQDVAAGNRGYIKGTPPPAEERSNLKRPLIAVDIDLPTIKGKPTEPTQLVGGGQSAPAMQSGKAQGTTQPASQEQIK